MPVSTRSQLSGGRDEGNVPSVASRPSILRNPHHGLKEKMRALTQFYEQHKNQMAGTRDPTYHPTHHPSVELAGTTRRKNGEKENVELGAVLRERSTIHQSPSHAVKKPPPIPFPSADAKENQEGRGHDPQLLTYSSCPKRENKSTGTQSEGRTLKARRTSGEMGIGAEKPENGTRIMVFVRLRPMAAKEREAGSRSCVRIVDGRDVYLTELPSETDYLGLKRVRGRHFSFDGSFPDSTMQQEVYSATTADLVEGVLRGRNGMVFCYGATGAGKTYTMLGMMDNPGVMVLAIKNLFSKIRQKSCDGDHAVHLSYLEVQYRAYTTDKVMALLQQGNLNRTTEPTRMNETSSRSHAILQVVAEYRERDASNVISRIGKLSLIDLAGSERAIATDQRTQRSASFLYGKGVACISGSSNIGKTEFVLEYAHRFSQR